MRGRLVTTIAVLFAAATAPIPAGAGDPGFIGLDVQGLDARGADALGAENAKGVLVKDVAVGEPGAIAGVRRGDLIVGFGGGSVANFDDLLKLVVKTSADQTVPITVMRAGERIELKLHTTAKPASWKVTKSQFHNYPDIGFTVAALDEKTRKQFSLPWGTVGLVVTIVDGKGAAAGTLRPGEVIVNANLNDLWEPSQLTKRVEEARSAGRKSLLLLVSGQAGYRYTLLPLK